MKNSIKTKISHLFKGKPSKLEKYPTYDPSSYKVDNDDLRSIESDKGKVHGNKKSHKKPKTNLTLNILEAKVKNMSEFPILPSPMTDPNESSKLTAQEFAKAVGIKILHRTDEEEDEDCDCEYCRAAHSNLNTVTTMDSNYIDDNATPTQPIPNVSLNQYSLNNVSIPSSNNTTIGSSNNNIDIPPFPAFNFNVSNERLPKCTSNTSLNTAGTNGSNHSIVNSRTIGTPGYYCHRSRKNSISKVIDMSLFVPPTEQELKNKVHSSSLSISSTPESSSIQAVPSNEKIMGGSLDRNRNVGHKKNYYGICISPNRDRSASASFASSNRPRVLNGSDYKTSPILRDSSIGCSSRIQFKQMHRCDSGTELSNANANANANVNSSSPNKRPYPPSLASSSSSTTLSSALSLTHISQPNLNSVSSPQSSAQSFNRSQENIAYNCYSPKPTRSPMSSCSSITPIKPHSSFKITRSVTVSEGGRHAEIDIQPLEKEEVKVYQKGRFTITCEHSRRPSVNSVPSN